LFAFDLKYSNLLLLFSAMLQDLTSLSHANVGGGCDSNHLARLSGARLHGGYDSHDKRFYIVCYDGACKPCGRVTDAILYLNNCNATATSKTSFNPEEGVIERVSRICRQLTALSNLSCWKPSDMLYLVKHLWGKAAKHDLELQVVLENADCLNVILSHISSVIVNNDNHVRVYESRYMSMRKSTHQSVLEFFHYFRGFGESHVNEEPEYVIVRRFPKYLGLSYIQSHSKILDVLQTDVLFLQTPIANLSNKQKQLITFEALYNWLVDPKHCEALNCESSVVSTIAYNSETLESGNANIADNFNSEMSVLFQELYEMALDEDAENAFISMRDELQAFHVRVTAESMQEALKLKLPRNANPPKSKRIKQ
jgi:hypothetical protein